MGAVQDEIGTTQEAAITGLPTKGTRIDSGPVTISQQGPRLYHATPGEPAVRTGTLLRVKQTACWQDWQAEKAPEWPFRHAQLTWPGPTTKTHRALVAQVQGFAGFTPVSVILFCYGCC